MWQNEQEEEEEVVEFAEKMKNKLKKSRKLSHNNKNSCDDDDAWNVLLTDTYKFHASRIREMPILSPYQYSYYDARIPNKNPYSSYYAISRETQKASKAKLSTDMLNISNNYPTSFLTSCETYTVQSKDKQPISFDSVYPANLLDGSTTLSPRCNPTMNDTRQIHKPTSTHTCSTVSSLRKVEDKQEQRMCESSRIKKVSNEAVSTKLSIRCSLHTKKSSWEEKHKKFNLCQSEINNNFVEVYPSIDKTRRRELSNKANFTLKEVRTCVKKVRFKERNNISLSDSAAKESSLELSLNLGVPEIPTGEFKQIPAHTLDISNSPRYNRITAANFSFYRYENTDNKWNK